MRRIALAALVAVSTLAAGLPGGGLTASPLGDDAALRERFERRVRPRPPDEIPRFVDGEVVVKFEKSATPPTINSVLGAQTLARIGGPRLQLVRAPEGMSTLEAVRLYRRAPGVAFAEPNLIRSYHAHVPATPNDPLFGELWGLNNVGQSHGITDYFGDGLPPAAGTPGADIDAPEAWDVFQGEGVIVAVMDSGVDVSHPDLAGQFWVNPGEIPDGLDNDGNGCIDDVNGCNFVSRGGDLSDGVGHGTHVAGTIAAAAHNGIGIAGVCPHCQIMVLKLGSLPTLARELAAIDYAIAHGADVVNMSFGSPVWSKAERKSLAKLGAHGILAVVSAGNSMADNDQFIPNASPMFPASYTLPNIISVAASNHHDEYGYSSGCAVFGIRKNRCAFTSFGHESVDIAAPGVDILSTIPPGSEIDLEDGVPGELYEYLDGTSMAAPHVAGVAGLLRSHAYGARNKLMNGASATATNGFHVTRSIDFRHGKAKGSFSLTDARLDADGALSASLQGMHTQRDANIGLLRGIRNRRTGRVAYPDDVNDVYSRRFRPGRYEITLDVTRRADLDLWVWRPRSTEIWEFKKPRCVHPFRPRPDKCAAGLSAEAGRGLDESIVLTVREAGKYFIHVSAWLQSKGRYVLRVRRIG